MIGTLSRYLLRFVAPRFILVSVGVTALALLLDTANNGDQLWDDGGLLALGRYALLRAPSIFTSLSVFSALIAILITLTELVRRSELVALMAAGWSQRNLLAAFAPAMILMAVAHYVVSDFALPSATQGLRDWGFEEELDRAGDSLWLRTGENVFRIGGVDTHGAMSDVSVFHLSEAGVLDRRIDAESGRYEDGAWQLQNQSATGAEGADIAAPQTIPLPLSPVRLRRLASDPRSLSLASLNDLVAAETFGARPPHVYRLYRQRKASQIFSILIMVCLAVPLVQRFQRQDATAQILASGIALGFVYLALDSFFVALGEAGILPIVMAAWGATGLFALVAGAMMLNQESL